MASQATDYGQHYGPIPYLAISGAARAIDFYKQVFGAVETLRMTDHDGRVGHATMRVGGAVFYLADEYPEINVRSPQTLGGSPVTIYLYVDDVDAVAPKALAAGATMLRAIADQPHGDRSCKIRDPFGHEWFVATRQREVSPEELRRSGEAGGYKTEVLARRDRR